MKSSWIVLAFGPLAIGAGAQMTPPAPDQPAAPPPGQWRTVADANGTAYETGTFDQPIDGGLRLACRADGSGLLAVQIKGAAPGAGARILVAPTSARRNAQSFTFTTNANGEVGFPRARTDRRLGQLWAALRGGTSATIRYPDTSFAVVSLAGAGRTLPPRPCR